MTTVERVNSTSTDRRRCGCCGMPRARLTELGDTPGVFICAGCAIWAARRAGGLLALAFHSAGRLLRLFSVGRHTHAGSTALNVMPVLPSADLDRTARFYAALGFDIAGRYDGYLLLHDGPVELHFTQVAEVSPSQCFVQVLDAAALWKRLREHEVRGVGPLGVNVGFPEFTVADPDGNQIRIGSPAAG